MAIPKAPKRQPRLAHGKKPSPTEIEPTDLEEQEDLDDQPATPELIARLGFNPDEEWPEDSDFWE